jgi:uroporphyrinogen-III synthase
VSLRVALTRPIEDGRRSAGALLVRGFEPVFAPATKILATGVEPPDENFDALLATSANAFAFLSAETRVRLYGLNLYVVGARTAAAARAAGLGPAKAVGLDAAVFAASLAAELAPASRLLYLAARHRKSDLESTLRAAGHRLVVAEIYVAQALCAWSVAEAEAFAACGAALHYSRRSAQLTAGLAERAGLGDRLRAILHVCISTDAAEPLRSFGAGRIVIATGAEETSLLDALSLAAKASQEQP